MNLSTDYGYDYEFIIPIEISSVSVEDNTLGIDAINLHNYPNPFNPNTTIFFETTNSHENAQIDIYNLKGQKVQEFDVILSDVEGESNSITWNGTDSNNQPVSSGIYFYQLKVDGKLVAKNRCLLLK